MWICASPRDFRCGSSFWSLHWLSPVRPTRWQGGAVAEEEEALAAAEVDSTAVRMGSMAAALVIPARRVAIPGTSHQAVQEASTNPQILEMRTTTTNHLRNITSTNHPQDPEALHRRNTTSTNHPQNPEAPQAHRVQQTSSRTTTPTTQTRRP